MKKIFSTALLIVFILAGSAVLGYPFISNYLSEQNASGEITTYLNSVKNQSDSEIEKMLSDAEEYNKSLVGNLNISDPFSDNSDDNDDEYFDLLKIDGSDVIASIEIPVLNLKYPIYHGTSDDVLKKGIGHMKNTSLPIGGESTHSVLTGHTGLSNAKLFTDIDKLETGDVFYIYVLDKTLAYSVDQIKVVEPSDTSALRIEEGEDYVTLVTCTPYGVNSHRLLVRGTRIPYEEAVNSEVRDLDITENTWFEEYGCAIIIGLSIAGAMIFVFAAIKIIMRIYRKKNNEK